MPRANCGEPRPELPQTGNAKRKRAKRDPRKTPDDLRATFHEISPPPDEG